MVHREPASRASFIPRKRGGVLTSEVDYTEDEHELLMAVEAWKKRTRKKFPTFSELLAIIRELGYRKPEPEDTPPAPQPDDRFPQTSGQ